MKKRFLLFALGAGALQAHAQLQVAGPFFIGAGATVAVVNGNVAATTPIQGTGTLLMTGTAAQTLNMNGNSLASLQVNNTAGVTLTGNATVSNLLTFTAGPVTLGASNLTFGPAATSTGAGNTGYVVTNGTGTVTKQSLANAGSFTFPVGATAATDYTPATVTNTAAARDISTRVLSNTGTAPLTGNAANGINRIWQITGSTAGTATVALTDQAANEGSTYTNTAAFVTQQVADGVWSVGTPSAGPFVHSGSFTVPATTATNSYFSKSDDVNSSISANAQLDLTVALQGPTGSVAMTHDLQVLGIIPNSCPYTTGPAAFYNFATNPAGIDIVDWIQVRTLDGAAPVAGSPLQIRNLLLKTNGHIVDVDGSIPVFNGRSVTTRVAILHRNHLAILSNVVDNVKFAGQRTYDFTDLLAKASNDGGDPPQMIRKSGKWCMWDGDVNQDLFLDGGDISIVNASVAAANDGTYQATDFTLDGYVDAAETAVLNANLAVAPNSTLIQY